MSLTSRAAASLARQSARQTLPAVRQPAALIQQKREKADAATSHAEFHSPFHRGTHEKPDTTVIPSFKKYRSGGETTNKMFQYFMVGAFGGLSALGAKDTVQSMRK
jgi:ubiquinol-cytochrome c reductase iron-sulfur subunit